MDGRGLLFPGEFVSSANVAALLLYNSSPEGAAICIAPKECKCESNTLGLHSPKKYQAFSCAENPETSEPCLFYKVNVVGLSCVVLLCTGRGTYGVVCCVELWRTSCLLSL